MDGNNPQYGSLTPNLDDNQEKKKDDKKKKVMIGLAVLALLGASAVCIGTSILDRPQPIPEEEVAVRVTPTKRAKLPQSTPTEVVQEPVVVLEGWFGNYEGTAEGFRETLCQGTKDFDPFKDDELVWLEIMDEDDCFAYSYCNEDRSWGIDIGFVGHTAADSWTNIRIYLPDNLDDAPGMALTESMLAITPTNEHPYELIIDQVDGKIEGYLQIDGVPSHSGNAIEWWIVEELSAEKSDAPDPALR